MIKEIYPPRQLNGVLRVPGDRSITVRAILLGSIADGTSVVREYLDCDDTGASVNIMRELGIDIHEERDNGSMLRIHGASMHGLHAARQELFCNSSGTTMRLLAGLMAGQTFASTIDGSEQLRNRPMRRIVEPLTRMGALISSTSDHAPLYIKPANLHGIDYLMQVASAQVKSALLLAALYADGDVIIRETATTRDHTERMLSAMGVAVRYGHQNGDGSSHAALQASEESRLLPQSSGQTPVVDRQISIPSRQLPGALHPLDMTVPADFSSAAFFLVAAILHPHSRLELPGTGLNPTRTGLLEALRAMGAVVMVQNSGLQGGEPVGDLVPVTSRLRAMEVSGALTSLMIDEFPIFAVAATQAVGTTVVRNAEELRVKESNRIDDLVVELRKMGAHIEATSDGFIVAGPATLRGAVVDAHGDHRMAMSLAVAGLIAEGKTTLTGAECVSKTYPGFFDDLAAISASSDK